MHEFGTHGLITMDYVSITFVKVPDMRTCSLISCSMT